MLSLHYHSHYRKSVSYVVSEKNWNTKGEKGTAYGKSHDKATLSSEEVKPVALSIAELSLAEGISYSVSHQVSLLVENSVE